MHRNLDKYCTSILIVGNSDRREKSEHSYHSSYNTLHEKYAGVKLWSSIPHVYSKNEIYFLNMKTKFNRTGMCYLLNECNIFSCVSVNGDEDDE